LGWMTNLSQARADEAATLNFSVFFISFTQE
jgi:hypothetical protein